MSEQKSVKWMHENVLGQPMTWFYFLGEVKEFLEDRNYDEFSDVVATFYLALYNIFPFVGKLKPKHAQVAFNRWIERKKVWQLIFNLHGLDFDKKCYKKGGNYFRDYKIKAALQNANYTGEIKWKEIEIIRQAKKKK